MRRAAREQSSGGRTGAKALVESLERAGAQILFGYPGGNVIDIFNLLPASKMKFVLGRHEQGCVHMADGYARATGRPGVALVTSGPGATNAITGLGTANMDGIPLVLVSGQVPLSEIGTDAFQEADMSGICRAVTKHSFLVKSADEIPETVAEAFYIATHGKPGAVVIDLPRNVQREICLAQYPERISLRAYHPECPVPPGSAAALAGLVNRARRPVIYAGGGVIASGASADLKALAEKAQIPVATSLMGVGAFDTRDPLSLGMAGVYGTKAANAAIASADLVLALGVRFNDRMTAAFPPERGVKTVHVDCDASSIEKNVPVSLGIVADIKDVLTTISSRVKPARHDEWLRRLAALARRSPARRGTKGIAPADVVRSVAAAVGGDAIVVTDVGQHQMFAAREFPHSCPRRFISSGGMGTMGFGIPAAIGAALAMPGEKVVALVGDGGAQMTAEELKVAADERLGIVFVVFNNSSLGMIRQMQERYFVGNFTNPDFMALARAYGLRGVRVEKAADLDRAMARAVRAKGPVLVEVKVDRDARA